MRAWDGIVLDLDDTILESSRLLVPAGDRRAVEALRAAGIAVTIEAGLAALKEARRRAAGRLDWAAWARRLGGSDELGASAERAFHAFEVPPLELDDDARAALDALGALAPLALLTLGDPATQRAKIERLGIAPRFVDLRVVPRDGHRTKVHELADLLAKTGWDPARVAVVGDSLASDVAAGNANGCRTVRVRGGGEWAHEEPRGPHEVPWRTCGRLAQVPELLASGPGPGRPSG